MGVQRVVTAPTEGIGDGTIDQWRGHPIAEVNGTWVYTDTGEPVAENKDRPCGHCKQPNRADGHDACLGEIEGALNACCGHGDPRIAYVQMTLAS